LPPARVRGGDIERGKLVRPEREGAEPTIASDDLSHREVLRAPPSDVGLIAERAHHQDPGALLRVGELAREDRHGHLEERRDRALAEPRLVALVVGMRGDADTRGQELGARRRDDEASASLDRKFDFVESALLRSVLDLRLRDRGLEIDVPHRRGLERVHVAFSMKIDERQLREAPAAVVDRRVGLRPVDAEAEAAEERLEGPLVLSRHAMTERDERRARHDRRRLLLSLFVRRDGHTRGELASFEGQVGFAANVEEVLDAPLGGQTVVIPAHRIEHVHTEHAALPDDDVRMRVAEDVSHVERARDRGRRRVDDERLRART
jgi:hypothetical protein